MCVATKVMRLYCLAIVAGSLTLSAAIAEDVWYPVAVDVWSPPFNAEHRGDTVNIAARMAGKAMPGGVAVTDESWRQIKDRFEGESLGDLEVKGKGTIRIVAVQARATQP